MYDVLFKILKKYVSLQYLYFVTPCDYIINGNQYIRLYFFLFSRNSPDELYHRPIPSPSARSFGPEATFLQGSNTGTLGHIFDRVRKYVYIAYVFYI